ncbi:collagen alpha-1(I) chain isoform X1 [Herpailurus yagouaroundi]|uniref:collagen alpha-1(I) chain isoform X1 n=1 Tax=Herpailurus yagouaroundi TaxID=1608482 RepID=UPI001AD77705|nr:collagen alpha-1(I) chain-like isoform X1 [Puma yagouaroundi]XP_040346483.1 collagen alpha-1(I) chain-like isoform X1 [Puma yagouaroundi]XP_040346484.1 collagen alpha-1(I) chain-like isoform X1 [Puma yagouaroundi]XP_040346485.1 collagen alpha-1(I) chain-like isoform X1 [Puma yagouaroundi]XP_040346486.1 collagen alpha-1(I) chain-like isoform X1 [Puma yagouaroundi]XP_040346487.1 collagen alpha-1(I) chain-like isoform X1 [Puma yagouaroundi]XP_040346488.1 collagen alpha-1(I) chain-like isoform
MSLHSRLPPRIAAPSRAISSVRRESVSATALGKSFSPDHPEPLERVSSGWRELGQEEASREGTACPPPNFFWPGPPGPPRRRGGRTSRVDITPPCRCGACPCPGLLAAFVFLGLHKMAAAAFRHFVSEAGGRVAGGGGGRETTARPPAPSGLDGAQQQPPPQPGLGRGCPGLGTSQSLGKAVREPRPFTQPAGPLATPQPPLTSRRRCCRPEPRRAVIKAMLLEGVLAATGPARTVLEMTLARVGGDGLPGPTVTRAPSVSGHTGETSGPLSPTPATLPPYLPEEPPGSLAGPRAGPGAHGGQSGFRSGRSYCPSSGSRDGGLPGGGELCSRASRGAGASRESKVHQAGGEPVPAQPAALRSPLFRGTHIPRTLASLKGILRSWEQPGVSLLVREPPASSCASCSRSAHSVLKLAPLTTPSGSEGAPYRGESVGQEVGARHPDSLGCGAWEQYQGDAVVPGPVHWRNRDSIGLGRWKGAAGLPGVDAHPWYPAVRPSEGSGPPRGGS